MVVKGQAAMPAGTGKIDHGETTDPGPFVRGQLAETVMGGVQCLRAGTGCDLKEDDGRSRRENSDKPDRHENDTWCASSHEVSMVNCESPANLQMLGGRRRHDRQRFDRLTAGGFAIIERASEGRLRSARRSAYRKERRHSDVSTIERPAKGLRDTGVSTGVVTDMTRNRQDRTRFPAGPRKRPFRLGACPGQMPCRLRYRAR